MQNFLNRKVDFSYSNIVLFLCLIVFAGSFRLSYAALTFSATTVSSDGALNSVSTGNFNFTPTTANADFFTLSPATGGLGAFSGIFTSSDLTADRTWTFPNVSGTVITTGDTGSVTNTMLAGSITEGKLSFTDNTTGDATASAHGLLPKLGGGTTNYLRADGTWSAPTGNGGVSISDPNTFTGLNKFTNGLESYRGGVDTGVTLGLRAGLTDTSDSVNIGYEAGYDGSGNFDVRVGRHAGAYVTAGNAIFIGHAPGQYGGEGGDCSSGVVIGYLAARNTPRYTPHYCFGTVAIGSGAAENGRSSQTGVFVGTSAGNSAQASVASVMIGWASGAGATNSGAAVLLGPEAGRYSTSAVNSVMIGSQAGRDLVRNHSLVIDSSATYAPAGNTGLIYGEFDNRLVTINGWFKLGAQPAKPTCAVAYRGMHVYVPGGAGVADTYEVCMKDASDAYAWEVVATP